MAFFSKVAEPARVTDSTVHFSLPEKAEAVMADLKDQKKALQERVIAIINRKAELLGRCPEKRDLTRHSRNDRRKLRPRRLTLTRIIIII